jgi:hypothetical protein
MYLEIVDALDKTGNWRLDIPAKSERVSTNNKFHDNIK